LRQHPYVIIVGFSLGIPNFKGIRNTFTSFIDRVFAWWRKQKAPQLQENTLAATLERDFPYSEAAINFIDGSFCSNCNKIHTQDELENLGLSPEKLLGIVEDFRSWALKNEIEFILKSLTKAGEENIALLAECGYSSVVAAQRDLKRLQAILAWQPAATPAANMDNERTTVH